MKVLIEKRKCDNFLQKLRKVSSHNINSLLNVKLEISSEIDKIRVILGRERLFFLGALKSTNPVFEEKANFFRNFEVSQVFLDLCKIRDKLRRNFSAVFSCCHGGGFQFDTQQMLRDWLPGKRL